jgi:hypothetical protein
MGGKAKNSSANNSPRELEVSNNFDKINKMNEKAIKLKFEI